MIFERLFGLRIRFPDGECVVLCILASGKITSAWYGCLRFANAAAKLFDFRQKLRHRRHVKVNRDRVLCIRALDQAAVGRRIGASRVNVFMFSGR